MSDEHLSYLVGQLQRRNLAHEMFLKGYRARIEDDRRYDGDFDGVDDFRAHINELFEEYYTDYGGNEDA
jgi:hypothetical protein